MITFMVCESINEINLHFGIQSPLRVINIESISGGKFRVWYKKTDRFGV